MVSARTLRARIKEELREEIIDRARTQLATYGANGLSLRAIARDLEMASSAVYRYFSSRDDLLTALIVDGYNAVGAAVEQADAGVDRNDHAGRWLTACRATRTWATAHPHEYALVYGSPVPGYHAPTGTVLPAAREKIAYGRIISDAHRAGALRAPDIAPSAPKSFSEDARRLRDVAMPGVPDATVIAALTAMAGLHGLLGLELFGHFNNMIEDRSALFDQAMVSLGRLIGLKVTPLLGERA